MSPLSIVKYFNIFKHGISCFCSCLIGLTFNTLLFHCSKETLHERIVITITFSAHTHLYFSFFEHGQIALTRILTSSIRVMHETSSWLALAQRHFCRFCDNSSSRSRRVAHPTTNRELISTMASKYNHPSAGPLPVLAVS